MEWQFFQNQAIAHRTIRKSSSAEWRKTGDVFLFHEPGECFLRREKPIRSLGETVSSKILVNWCDNLYYNRISDSLYIRYILYIYTIVYYAIEWKWVRLILGLLDARTQSWKNGDRFSGPSNKKSLNWTSNLFFSTCTPIVSKSIWVTPKTSLQMRQHFQEVSKSRRQQRR